jgi:hypothetical protein
VTCMFVCCGIVPNEVVISGPEKLKSILGSTLAEVDTKEFDCEYDGSTMLFAVNEAIGAGEDMP